MGVTNAVTIDAEGIEPAHVGRPGRRRHGDRLGRVVRHRRHRARRADGAVRPAGRAARHVRKAPMQRHEGGYYIRLLARDRPGTAATIAKRLAEQEISLESIVQRHRQRRAGRRDQSRRRPGYPHHLCDHRGCGAQGPCGGGAR